MAKQDMTLVFIYLRTQLNLLGEVPGDHFGRCPG